MTTNRTLSLQNLSSGARDRVYGDTGGDQAVKVVDDEQLRRLLDALAATGMFARATASAAPGAKAVITVETPEQRLVWSRPTPTTASIEEVRRFEEGRGYVLAVYNSETAYHQGTIDSFPAATRDRIERAKAAVSEQGPPK